jgi:glycosyltransferase involved in cell wall biosynthesis
MEKPARIVLISDWFAEKMGYSENCLPKALAALGHTVHLITSNAQPYFDSPTYRETYEPFIGPGLVDCETKSLDGYTLHRLPIGRWARRLRLQGLRSKLKELRPEVVQTFDALTLSTLEAAWAQPALGYPLFLETHLHASVFDPERRRRHQRRQWSLYRRTAGRLINQRAVKCYAIAADAAQIATEFLGLAPAKVEICGLGVDTQLFRPPTEPADQAARGYWRRELGFEPEDLVCIYTGRFAASKGPQILAEAIGRHAGPGPRLRGLFVGGGTAAEIAAIQSQVGCVVHPFVPARELPPYYWAADIGVWPRQESTSQLDAAACGLPIIISDRVTVRERVEGNGLFYPEGDTAGLQQQILALANRELRQNLGRAGSRKVIEHYSWLEIARRRAQDYAAALAQGSRV